MKYDLEPLSKSFEDVILLEHLSVNVLAVLENKNV